MRRLRRTPALRRLVAEHHVRVDDLVAPLFVKEGIDAFLQKRPAVFPDRVSADLPANFPWWPARPFQPWARPAE